MLSLLKKRPFLKDLLPPGYIDIHSHLLPGIDDGAKTIDDSASLIAQLSEIGFCKFITTPHIMAVVWENTPETIKGALSEVKSTLPNVRIKAAAEYLMDANFVKLFQSGAPLLTLKDDLVLVEMSYLNPPIQLFQIIFDLQLAGYRPVLAHPERYNFYHNNFREYEKLHNAGCLFQMNLLSTVGYYGKAVAIAADELLKKGLIDLTGSDVHHLNHVRSFERRLVIKHDKALMAILPNNRQFDF